MPEDSCEDINSINVIYNGQETICPSVSGNGDDCLDSEDVCGVVHPYDIPELNGIPGGQQVVIGKEYFNGFSFKTSAQYEIISPVTLRVGDYNKDGSADIAMILTNGTSTQAVLWHSIPCGTNLCTQEAIDQNRRTFENDPATSVVGSVANPFVVTFFDFRDDGTLDILVVGETSTGPSGRLQIIAIENDVDYGAYFFKVKGLSGLCMSWCDSPRFPSPLPIGVNQPGAVFKYIWSDNDQEKRVTIGTQFSQSGYLALQTPYVYFGIGTTSHYVQTLYSGFPISNGVSLTTFTVIDSHISGVDG